MKRMNEPVLVVVFGASGDLVKRKLIPAMYHLAVQKLLPPNFALLGYARTAYSDEEFRQEALTGLRDHMESEHDQATIDEQLWQSFAENIF